MSELWQQLKNALSTVAGSWAAYTAIGSFFLYVLGYLSIRFHLTALGIGTDLAVVDERYFYAGARFLVYLTLTLPIILLFALVLALLLAIPALIAYSIYRAIRKRSSRFHIVFRKLREWSSEPALLALVGILISESLIQFVMRQCLLFNNLLVAPQMPNYWPRALFFHETLAQIFFSGLITGTFLTTVLLFRAWGQQRVRTANGKTSALTRFLIAVLAILVSTQFFLLAVNHGVLVADKVSPRVANLGDSQNFQPCVATAQAQVKPCQEVWLVWESAGQLTYLVRNTDAGGAKTRTLVTLSRNDVKRIEIVGYDHILRVAFNP
jgi:hypothetical protein